MRHPETELIAFVRGELNGPEYDRVARHLASCADCRAVRDDFRRILDDARPYGTGPTGHRRGSLPSRAPG